MEQQALRDIRIEAANDIERHQRVNGPRATCEECGERLPRGVHRRLCVMHSPYVQGIVHELIGRERRRRQAQDPTRRVA